MPRGWKKPAFLSAIALLLALAAAVAGFPAWFPKTWRGILAIETPPKPADAIVLLGGEPQGRPVKAAELYRAGVAPLVVVVGTGDNDSNRRTLLESGVPAARILTETHSTSTIENAEFSRRLLLENQIRTALLVTSSYHARRALGTFQRRIPEIEFGVATSRIGWWDTPQGRPQEDHWAAKEIVKLAGHWILHGIPPWTAAAETPREKAGNP